MLTVQQLERLKNVDPYLFEGLRKTIDALNAGFRLAGIDPMPAAQAAAGQAIPPPAPPLGMTVTAPAGGYSFVTITKAPTHSDAVLYQVESSTTSNFAVSTLYHLGHSTQFVVPNPGGLFWRAAAKYQMSALSNYVKP